MRFASALRAVRLIVPMAPKTSSQVPEPPPRSLPALVWRLFVRAFWLPALVLAVHGVASLGFQAYDRLVPLDVPMHLAGGLAIAWAWARGLAVLVEADLVRRPDRPLWYLLVFALTCTAAVFWEFGEWVSDSAVGTHAQIGLEDTLFDMALGIVGGILFLLVFRVQERGRRR